MLGPTFILKSVFQATSMARRFVAEAWLYPDGSRILELSTKCLPSEAFQVAPRPGDTSARTASTVGAGTQQTKTKTALEFFSAQLRDRGAVTSEDIALDGLGTDDDDEALPSNADDADDDALPTTASSDDEDDAGDRR